MVTEPRTNYVVQIYAYNRAGDGLPGLQQAFTTEESAVVLEPKLMPPLEVSCPPCNDALF